MLGDDLEELDRELPVSGEFLRHDRIEPRQIDLFGFDHVDEVGEIGGKIRGLSGSHVDDRGGSHAALGRGLEAKQVPEGKHEPHQSQPSRQARRSRLRR